MWTLTKLPRSYPAPGLIIPSAELTLRVGIAESWVGAVHDRLDEGRQRMVESRACTPATRAAPESLTRGSRGASLETAIAVAVLIAGVLALAAPPAIASDLCVSRAGCEALDLGLLDSWWLPLADETEMLVVQLALRNPTESTVTGVHLVALVVDADYEIIRQHGVILRSRVAPGEITYVQYATAGLSPYRGNLIVLAPTKVETTGSDWHLDDRDFAKLALEGLFGVDDRPVDPDEEQSCGCFEECSWEMRCCVGCCEAPECCGFGMCECSCCDGQVSTTCSCRDCPPSPDR
jgi:hypothetical protein